MKENNTAFEKIIFGFELALFLVIPFVIWWSTTPTNVLNSNSLYKLLEAVGIWGSGIFLLIGIPAGIIGIIKVKRMIKFRKAIFIIFLFILETCLVHENYKYDRTLFADTSNDSIEQTLIAKYTYLSK